VHADPFFTIAAYLAVLTFGVASVMVQSYVLSCVFGTIAWSCFYHAFRTLIETQFPKTSALVDQSDKAWSVAAAYTSFFYQFGVCFVFGMNFLGTHYGDKIWWAEGMAGDDWYLRRVEQQLFFATMGYELKDFMRSPFPDVGLITHHIFTLLGCTLCLLTPGGVGTVCINCINAQVGSGFYNAFLFYPTQWNFWLFVAMMSLSNSIAIWLFVEYLVLQIPLVWHVCYGLVVFALILMRQGNVILMCVKRATSVKSEPEHTAAESDPLARRCSGPTATTETSNIDNKCPV
jgi:hypothetical protein